MTHRVFACLATASLALGCGSGEVAGTLPGAPDPQGPTYNPQSPGSDYEGPGRDTQGLDFASDQQPGNSYEQPAFASPAGRSGGPGGVVIPTITPDTDFGPLCEAFCGGLDQSCAENCFDGCEFLAFVPSSCMTQLNAVVQCTWNSPVVCDQDGDVVNQCGSEGDALENCLDQQQPPDVSEIVDPPTSGTAPVPNPQPPAPSGF